MSSRQLKSTARLWSGAKRPEQKFRDRKLYLFPDGVRREVYGYGRTKTAATADLVEKLAKLDREAEAADAASTVTQVLARLVRHKRNVRGRKAKTIFNDIDLFRRHVAPHIGHKPIDQVTLEDLEAIQSRLTTAGKWRTAELATIQLRSIYKHALKIHRAEVRAGSLKLFDLTEDLEAVRRPPEARSKPTEAWTVDQLTAFLTEAKCGYDASRSSLLYPVFYTAIAAGLRRGELLGLTRADLRVDGEGNSSLLVDKQLVYYAGRHHPDTPKSDAGEREIPITPELAQVLKAHMAKLDEIAAENPEWTPTDLLFPSYNGRPMEPRSLYRAKDRIIAKLKLPASTLHELRAVYATYVTRELVRQGKYSPKLVMRLLGQSHPDVAILHYNRVVGEDLSAATFDPYSGGDSGISSGTRAKVEDAES